MALSLDVLHQLPPLSPQAVALLESLDEKAGAHDVVSLVECDPGLSVRVLRIANSAFYGMPGRVSSIREAVLLLGMSAIRSIALASVMSNVFSRSSGGILDLREYWRDSFLVALYAQALARKWGADESMAFTAGLLNDIGLIVLELTNPLMLQAVFRGVQENALSVLEAEKAVLGIQHYEIGADLLASWHLPAPIVQAVWLQAMDELVRENLLASVVNLAKTIVSAKQECTPEEMAAKIESKCRVLGVDSDRLSADLSEWDKLDAMVLY